MSWLFMGCGLGSEGSAPTAPGPAKNQVLFDQVRIDRYERDALRYRASMAKARLDRASGQVAGERLSAEVRSDEGRTWITAPVVTTNLRSSPLVRLSGGVRIRDDEGRILRTERVRYDTEQDRLETSAPVHLEGANFSARAEGRLVGSPVKKGVLEVEGPASGRVTPASRSND